MANVRQLPRLKFVSISAPTGGWNARDSYADMGPLDAVTLTNYWPKTTSVAVRYGFSKFATGMSGKSESLLYYSGGSTTKFFSCNSGGDIYDVTAGGAVGAADVSGLTNGRWQYVNVATTGGNYILAVNGADKMRIYDGSTWDYDGAGSFTVTGVDTAACNAINIFKNRVWLIPSVGLKAWYLPTEAIAGAAAALDLSAFAPHGGSLVAMGTFTVDGGSGVDDYAIFLTNRGDVIMYQGTDPSSATTWALRGVWWLGSPVGNRPIIKWKGDLLICCQDGVFPLSAAMMYSRLNPRVALTDKIQSAISSAVTLYGSNFGWQLQTFPKNNMLLVNIPVAAGSNQEQYAMNTLNGSWASFTGWPANCFELYLDNLYFGGDTYVAKAWDTNADAGATIQGLIIPAFSDFGAPGQRKRVTAMRPQFLTNGSPEIFAGVNWDYDLSNPTSTISTSATTFGVWDSGLWDTAIWGGGLNPSLQTQSATGSGFVGAPVFKSGTSGLQLELVNTQLSVEFGGFL